MARRSRSRREDHCKRNFSSRRRLAFEPLEARRLLAIMVDTNLDVVDIDDGLTSLREAIFTANMVDGADTIEFAPALTASGPATILLTQGELAITDALTIDGPGATLLTIDAQQQSRIFNITATTGDFEIDGLTFTNGRTTGSQSSSSTTTTFNGGALRFHTTGAVTLADVIVTNSQTTGLNAKGGGVAAGGDLTLVDCQFLDNGTLGDRGYGGAIYTPGSLTIAGSDISDNTIEGDEAVGTGAFAVGPISIEQSTILRNIASGLAYGSAIYGHSSVSLMDSEVNENERGVAVVAPTGASLIDAKVLNNQGGGVTTDLSSSRTIILLRSVVSGNTKGGPLGGAGLYTRGAVELQSSEVTYNQTTQQGGHGGGIHARYGGLIAIDSVIAHNSTAGTDAYGGGVFTRALATLINTRIEGNSTSGIGAWGGGIYAYELTALAGSVISGNRTTGIGAPGGGTFAKKVTLQNVVVENNYTTGQESNGGGIYADSVNISNSLLAVNATRGDLASGGAVFAANPFASDNTTIADSAITGNSTLGVSSHGGGVFSRGDLSLVGVSLVGNSTQGNLASGGGAYVLVGYTTMDECIISGNGTTGQNADGGGIYGKVAGLSIASSTISGNHTAGNDSDGGGVRVAGITVSNSALHGNFTLGERSRGGGIFSTVSASLAESTISGNYTAGMQSHGGGIATVSFSASRSTIAENHADHGTSYAGGVWSTTSITNAFSIVGTVIAQNTALGGNPDLGAMFFPGKIKHSLIGNKLGTSWAEAPVGAPDVNGNLIGGPVNGAIDPLLGPLADNGGLTWTHALLVGSPAIDAGDPAAVAGSDDVPEFDQRGTPWSRVVGGRIEIGAVELQANPLAGDYNFNGVVDAADYSVWRDTLGSTNDLRADGSGASIGVPDGVVDEHDYDFWKASFGNVLSAGGGSASFTLLAEPVVQKRLVEAGKGLVELTPAAPIWRSGAQFVAHAQGRRIVVSRLGENRAVRSDVLNAWLASRGHEEIAENETVLTLAGDETADSAGHDAAFDRVFNMLGS